MVNQKAILFGLILLTSQTIIEAKKQQSTVVSDITEVKDFKKLLKSKTNVLVMYLNTPKSASATTDVVKEAAKVMKGQATVVIIDCSSSEGKRLCKKLKVQSEGPYYLKHYKNGEFHKDYDRSLTVSSMTNFLRDPTGDLPWEEDPEAVDIFHLQDGEALNKFLRKSAAALKKSLILFYAPWCGYCKILKPDYVLAAGDLKGEALLAAIDVSKPGNSKIRLQYNITGFPTILYYEKGNFKFPYDGENKRAAMVEFIKDPTAHLKEKAQKPVKDESWSADSDVIHLTTANIDDTLAKAEHAIVVFYAPWCGHCKKIKPEAERAASRVKTEKLNGIIAAVDATKESSLAKVFDVRGYPTLKYFHNSVFKYDVGHLRKEEQMVEFMKNPTEPPPPPPPERPWADEESPVRHLDSHSFRTALRKIKHALVMFYAPWCGHCKSTKPEFVKAAEDFADELMVAFAAVDCTEHKEICSNYDVTGYPTIKYFSYFDKEAKDYSGGRKAPDFVSYIHSQMGPELAKGPAQKANPGGDTGYGKDVVIATDDDFEAIIASNTPSFVMFFATWCGHCSEIKPVFSKLATAALNEKLGVKIVAVDAAENAKVADIAKIVTLPTFKFYKSGKETAYDGGRSYDDFVAFCKKMK